MMEKQIKKRLSACFAAVLAVTCMLSSIPVSAVSAGNAGTAQNLAEGKSYEVIGTSDWSTGDRNFSDPSGKKLTDGVIHTDDESFQTGEALVGYKVDDSQHQDFVIDLGGLKEVSGYAIHGWSVNDYAWYIWNLRHYSVSYLDDSGQWQMAVDTQDELPREDDTPSCYTWEGTFDRPVVASKVKFSIRCWSSGLFLSELQVFGVAEEPEVYENKALNRPYEKSEPYMEDGRYSYPDTNDAELTDGIIAGSSYTDSNWVGFNGVAGEKRFVQVDLGKPYDINKVAFTYLADNGTGINPPSGAEVTYSMDNNTFVDFPADFGTIDGKDGSHTIEAQGEAVTARYIRFTFTITKNWLFISEVEAYGGKASLDPNLPYLATDLPASKECYTGYGFELKVVPIMENVGDVEYVWTKDGNLLPDETSNVLSVTEAKLEDSGVYQVTVANYITDESGMKTEYATKSVPCTVTVSELKDPKILLRELEGTVPVIENGKVVLPDSKTAYYDVVIGGTDRETVIDRNGNVYEPFFDTEVNIVYKAVSTSDETDYQNADYSVKVLVPGKYQKSESVNKAPSTLPSIQEWKGDSGKFELTASSAIVANTATEKAVAQKMAGFFKEVLKRDISVKEGTAAKGDIALKIDASIPEMGKEGYYMDVTDSVAVRAPQETGLLYGAITVVQSLFSDGDKTFIPKGIARDYPAYEVRGAFLDVARMAFPLDYLEEMVKYMSWFKMNEFHLHLNDGASQGYNTFRVESDLENLTATDLYYGKEEYKAFQDRAADWGVGIISEIETPGHASAFNGVPGIKMVNSGSLDLSDRQTIETIKGLFDEMLDGDAPVFRNPVVHIGTDEYYAGTTKQLNDYVYELTNHMAEKGVNIRFWGAFLNNAGVPEGVSKTVPGSQSNLWASSADWDNTISPQQMMDYGYDLINSNGYNLYMVPGGVEYQDTLNHSYLFDRWDVTQFDGGGKLTNVAPLGHPQLLGANFLIWNDRGTSNCGFSIYDVFNRFQCGTTIVAEKTWHGAKSEDQTYADFAKRDKMFKDIAGGANPARKVNSETQTLVNLNFEDVDGNTVYDLSDNHLDATVTNGSFTEENGSTVLSFDGNGSMSLPVKSIGFPYTASFDLKVTEAPAANTRLFSSEDGTFYLNIDGTGKMGFKRDGFLVIVPDKEVRFDREGYTYTFDYQLPLDTWVNITLRSDKQFTYLDVGGKSYKAVNNVKQLPYFKPNKLDESSVSLISTESMFENMSCMVDNLVIKNPELKPDTTEKNANLALGCDVTASQQEDAGGADRNFYPGALTDGIKDNGNIRVSFVRTDPTTWAIIDLGRAKEINLVKIYFNESCPEYRISISENGEDWTEVLHETNGANGTTVAVDVPFATQKARYVKYEGLKHWQSQWGGYHGNLLEMEVYNWKGQFDVTVAKTENGTVAVDKTSADEGDEVTVTVTPADGYVLESLTVDGQKVTVENGSYTFAMPAKNVSIAAKFVSVAGPAYSVTIGSMTNGTVTADKQTASEGEKVTLTVTPASGYVIETVKINGNAITAVGGVYSFTMPAQNAAVTATFRKESGESYKITVRKVTGGVVIPEKTTAKAGETVRLSIAPESNYYLDSLYGNNEEIIGRNGIYSFVMPAEDVIITPTFRYYGSSSSGGGSYRPSKPTTPVEPTPFTPGWEQVDGVWKLKGESGDYLTGWQKVEGVWYYLKSNGAMVTGWFQDGTTWYYLKDSGAMATGWLKLGNIWYYLNAGGAMRTGWLFDNGSWYFLQGSGAMKTGWLQQGSAWYYLKPSGAMATGWNWVNGKCYYFYESGKMAQSTTVGGYRVDASGAWVK